MRTLRAIFNGAKRAGYIKESQYPFGMDKYVIQAGKGRKIAITLAQVGMIDRYDDGSRATAKFRDYWLFLYFCNGMNVADFVKLKHSNIENGEIFYIRQKTERTARTAKEIRVVITEPVKRIIDKWGNRWGVDAYLFPILTGKEDAMTAKQKTKYLTRAINKRMAEIGEKLGIGNISTYTARHTYASVSHEEGVSYKEIQEGMGHSSIEQTVGYIGDLQKDKRVKNAELLTKF